jgi:Short C-terminal domain
MLNPLTHRKVLRKGVPGKATIVSRGALDRGGTTFNLPMTLQVYVEGWTPYEVEDQWMVKAKDTITLSGWIPVRVDPDERDKVAIDWETLRERHEQEEAARRQALAASGPVTNLEAVGGPNVTFESQEIDLTQNPEAAEQVMQMLGLSGAQVSFEQAPAASPQPASEDPIARLERLAALKASGVLTEEEFQQQKRRILSEGG